MMKSLPSRLFRSINPVAASVSMKSLPVEKMTSMAIAPNTREILPMEVIMDKDLEKWCEEYEASRKGHELHFEISIAWDDDDEFEHEGYYHSVDDAIEALLKYKK